MTQLHFCTPGDVQVALPTLASRYLSYLQTIRDAVTEDILRYLRRNFNYNAAYVETLDAHYREPYERLNIYPAKIPFDPTGTTEVRIAYSRDFSDPDSVVDAAYYSWNDDDKKLVITLPWEIFSKTGAIQLTYAGGFQPDPDDATLYDCGPSLREAAIMETSHRLQTLVDRLQGQAEEASKNRPIKLKPNVGGLLPEVAFKIQSFRKPLGK